MPEINELLKKWNDNSISLEEVRIIIKKILNNNDLECLNDDNFINIIKRCIDKQRKSFSNGSFKSNNLILKNNYLCSEDSLGDLFYFIPVPSKSEEVKREVFRFDHPLPFAIMNRDNQTIEFSYKNKETTILISNNEDNQITFSRREIVDKYGNVKEISLFNQLEDERPGNYSESTSRIIPEQPDRIEQIYVRSLEDILDPENITRIITNKSIASKIESISYYDMLNVSKVEDTDESVEKKDFIKRDGIIINPEYTSDEDLLQAILEIKNPEVKAIYLEKLKNRKKEDFNQAQNIYY